MRLVLLLIVLCSICAGQTIVVWGDSQGNYFDRFGTHVKNMDRHSPNYAIGLGDYIANGRTEEWEPQLFRPIKNFTRLPRDGALVRGNHDGGWHNLFAPIFGWSWYAKTWGSFRIVVLDTNGDWNSVQLRQFQDAWLSAELVSSAWRNARYKIACWHEPHKTEIWSGCYYPYDSNGYLAKLFNRCVNAGATLILNGHSHSYQRGKVGNTHWIISGGGGGWLDGSFSGVHCARNAQWPGAPEMTVALSVHHYGILIATDQSLVWKAYDLNNRKIDEIRLR